MKGIGAMVTLKDIARMCNVSPSTVSNVLNGKNSMGDEVKQRVLEAVRETGYQPNYYARNMRTNKSGTVGIIVEDLCQFSSPFIVEMILEYLEQQGYRPILMNLRMYYKLKNTNIEDEDALCKILEPVVQQMEAIKVEGIIYVAAHCRMLKKVPKLIQYPAIYSYAYADYDKKSVIIDDETGANDMVSYLISKGHRDIGIIAGSSDNYHTIARIKGCQRAMFNAGILFDPDRLLYGAWDRESGYNQAKKILKKGITALWCMNDRMASGAYQAAREMGMEVGKDISIAGFDDHELASTLYPLLTTYELPLYAIGYRAAQMLVDLINGNEKALPPDGPLKLKGQMVIRNSVTEKGK